MPKKIKKTLNLPRPLVNKILAHAQQSSDNHTASFSCGLISADADNHKFYYPIPELTDTSNCFSDGNVPFQQTLKRITDKQQTVFACVFTAPNNTDTPDKNVFVFDQHYYIMNSLNTKGVLSMQGFYRAGNDFQKVELALEL